MRQPDATLTQHEADVWRFAFGMWIMILSRDRAEGRDTGTDADLDARAAELADASVAIYRGTPRPAP